MSTGRHSRASKSICSHAVESAKRHYQGLGYRFIGESIRTPFAEVDLAYESREGAIVLIEVKGVREIEFLERLFQSGQVTRLQRALSWWSDQTAKPVRMEFYVLIRGRRQAIFDLSDLI